MAVLQGLVSGGPDPRRRRGLVAVWLVSVSVLAGGLGMLRAGSSPLDDSDLARQRPGFADANPPRSPVPSLPGLGAVGDRGVVFFTRPERLPRLLSALADPDGLSLRRRAHSLVVAPWLPAGIAPAGVAVLGDRTGGVSRRLFMRVPRDRGHPVGCAVVGPDRTVRYRTEDPGQDRRLSEVLTAVGDT